MTRVSIKLMCCLAGLAFLLGPAKIFAQQDLKSAIYLTKSQRFDDAEVAFKKLIKAEPNNGAAYFYLGDNFISAYMVDTVSVSIKELVSQALPVYQDGVKADTANPLNYIGIGRMYLLQGNKVKANENFAKAKSFLPPYKAGKEKKIKEPGKYSLVLTALAEAQLKSNSVDTAVALPLLRESMRIDPKNPVSCNVLGDVYMMAGMTSDAIKYYGRADDMDSTQLDAKIKRGNIYMRAENLNAAIPYFEQAIKLDPNFAPAYKELGELYQLAGKYERSKANYKKYLDLSGNNVPAKVRYAISLFKAKDHDEAINQIVEILKVDKSRNYLNRIAAYCYHDKKQPDYDKAKMYMEDFLKNSTEDKIIRKDYQYYGRILTKRNDDFQKAPKDTARLARQAANYLSIIKSIDENIDKNRKRKVPEKDIMDKFGPRKNINQASYDSVMVLFNNAVKTIDEQKAEIDKGIAQLKKAFEMEPSDVDFLSEAAITCNRFQRYQDAADLYVKKLAVKEDATDYFNLGKVYYSGKMLDKAEASFLKVTTLAPEDLRGWVWVANTYASKDPELKEGLAKPKYEMVIEKALATGDTVKNYSILWDAYNYLGSYYLFAKEDYPQSRIWYNKQIALNPQNKNNVVRSYMAIAISYQKGKDWAAARDAYKKVLEVQPSNTTAIKAVDDLNKALNKK
jgi:tetratricopeptide (TPR) repeat protein